MRKVRGWTDEDLEELKFKPPDIEEIRGWAKKDDELFPPSELLRVEVAGATLNFTTDEGVLVVYMDYAHTGKTLSIENISELSLSDYSNRAAEIRARTVDNTIVCTAIFNHIPFVTNQLRHKQKVLTQMDCTVKTTLAGSANRWEELVTLHRGQVTELDWRGRKA